MADFTHTPSVGFTKEVSPRVSVAKFGDGYSQRIADGINNIDESWNLQFQNNSIETSTAIETFLQSKAGYLSFTWLPPGEITEVRVICPKWSKTYDSSIGRTINATFERVYGYV